MAGKPCAYCGQPDCEGYVLFGQELCEKCFHEQLDRFSSDEGRRAAMSMR